MSGRAKSNVRLKVFVGSEDLSKNIVAFYPSSMKMLARQASILGSVASSIHGGQKSMDPHKQAKISQK